MFQGASRVPKGYKYSPSIRPQVPHYPTQLQTIYTIIFSLTDSAWNQ